MAASTLVAVGLATAAIVGVWGDGFWTPELLKNALPLSGDAIAKIKAESLLLQDAGGFAGILLFTTMANLIGRRPVFAVAFVGSFAIIAYLFLTLNAAWQVYVLCPILGFFTISIMGGLVFYLPELFPTRLRSTGIAFGYNAARMSAAIVSCSATPSAKPSQTRGFKLRSRPACRARVDPTLLGLLVADLGAETRGKPLPEDEGFAMIRFDWFALVIVLAGMPVVALAAPAVHGKTFATRRCKRATRLPSA